MKEIPGKPERRVKGTFLDSSPCLSYNRHKVKRQRKKVIGNRMIILSALMTVLSLTPAKGLLSQNTIFRLKVVAEQANIRLKPDISSIIIRQVPKGTILSSTGKEEEWFAVRLPSDQETAVSGYVHESLVAVIEPLPGEKKRPEKPEKKEVLIPPPHPQAAEPAERALSHGFSLALSGGGRYIAGGDLNPGIRGLADLYGDILRTQGEGKMNPVHFGYSLDIELSFPLSSRLSWGIGLEFLQEKNESFVEFRQGSILRTLHARPRLSAVPINLFLSVAPFSHLYFKGGISYYFARFSYLYQIQGEGLIQGWEGKATARGLGLMGGLGFIKEITPSLSLVAEGTGRWSKIDGFKGKGTSENESGEILTEEGKLYFIQNQVLEEKTHSTLFIRRTKPNEVGVIEAREAKIDFSGFSLRVGLRFAF